MIPAFEHDPNSRFLGFPMSQNRYAIPAWSHFFELVKPARVIEVGTSVGGMTCCLGVACKNIGARLWTFDKWETVPAGMDWWFDVLGITYCCMDVFEGGRAYIQTLLQEDGMSVVLCDGGDKVREFHQFAPMLKAGDYIATHDWHADNDWPWREIEYRDIDGVRREQNLVEVHQTVFERTGWRVFQKEEQICKT